MTATAEDIVLVLTGGSFNTNPNESLGGDPSNQPIIGTLNNLFDNISDTDAAAGVTDYRCIYIFNNNEIDSFYNVKLYISSQVADGADVQLGIFETTETQRITVTGTVTSGSFQISYTPPASTLQTRTVTYNADQGVWATNLETAINSIDTLSCTVTAAGTFGNRIFNILFDDNRSHDLLGVSTSGLVGSGLGIDSAKSTTGSPINAIPTLLEVETTPPFEVSFVDTSVDEPIEIGTLYPEEGFPIWIKRTIPAGATAMLGDGFSLKILASPV